MISDTLIELCKELDQENLIRILKGNRIIDGYGPGLVGPGAVRGSNDNYPAPWRVISFPGLTGISSIVCTAEHCQKTIVSMIKTEWAERIVAEVNNNVA